MHRKGWILWHDRSPFCMRRTASCRKRDSQRSQPPLASPSLAVALHAYACPCAREKNTQERVSFCVCARSSRDVVGAAGRACDAQLAGEPAPAYILRLLPSIFPRGVLLRLFCNRPSVQSNRLNLPHSRPILMTPDASPRIHLFFYAVTMPRRTSTVTLPDQGMLTLWSLALPASPRLRTLSPYTRVLPDAAA